MSKRVVPPYDWESQEKKKLRRTKSEDLGLYKAKPLSQEELVDALSEAGSDQRFAGGPKIHSLISTMYRLEKMKNTIPQKTIISHNKCTEPYFSPARNPWRLAKTLDSMAALLISKPRGERISLSLRVHELPGIIEVFIAGNGPVEKHTIQRLIKIWKDLGHFSRGVFRSRSMKNSTPRARCSIPRVMRGAMKALRHDALKWSFAKLQKRVNSPQFKVLADTKVPTGDYHLSFARIQAAILELEHTYTGKDAKIGRPADDMELYWGEIWRLLDSVRSSLDALRWTADHPIVWYDYATEKYLNKVVDIMSHVRVMVKAAVASNLAHLFQFDIRVTAVNEHRQTIFRGPDSESAWAWVFERAVQYYNKHIRKHKEWASFNDTWEKDVEALGAQNHGHEELVVHSELKMLLHCVKANQSGAHVFTYIGNSKSSCMACLRFLQVFNSHFGYRFVIHGSDGKMHWPWRFPVDCPDAEAILELVYHKLTKRWVEDYGAFRLVNKPYSAVGSGEERN